VSNANGSRRSDVWTTACAKQVTGASGARTSDGGLLLDDDFLVLINAWWGSLELVVPVTRPGHAWTVEIDSFDLERTVQRGKARAEERVPTGPRSVVVLRGPVAEHSGVTR
jgi:hypothetical protein